MGIMKQKYYGTLSERFCLNCNKITTFAYIYYLCHSRCTECGGWRAKNPNKKEEIKNNKIDKQNQPEIMRWLNHRKV